jgi:hypothetical protein
MAEKIGAVVPTDHDNTKHVTTGTPSTLGDANAEGSSVAISRLDHVHADKGFTGVLVNKSSNQTVSWNATVRVTWDSQEYDTNAMWPGADSSYIVIPSNGFYKVCVRLRVQYLASAVLNVNIRRNGGVVAMEQFDYRSIVNGSYGFFNLETILSCTAGQTIDIMVQQQAIVADLTILGSSAYYLSSSCSVVKLR